MNKLNEMILGATNEFQSMSDHQNRLATRWEKYGYLRGLNTKSEKRLMATLLQNQAQNLRENADAINATGAGEAWSGAAVPLVRNVFGKIHAQDFVSVQPMTMPSGYVFYLDMMYGTDSGTKKKGDSIYGNITTGPGEKTMGVNQEVKGGFFGSQELGYTNKYATSPTASAAVAKKSGGADNSVLAGGKAPVQHVGFDSEVANKYYKVDVSFTQIGITKESLDLEALPSLRLVHQTNNSGSIPKALYQYTRLSDDKSKLEFFVPSNASADPDKVTVGDTFKVTYPIKTTQDSRGSFEDTDGKTDLNIPTLTMKINKKQIVADTKKLKAAWTPEFTQDINRYQGIDGEKEITNTLAEFLTNEIDLTILQMLIDSAATVEQWSVKNNNTFQGGAWSTSHSPSFYNDQPGWFATLGTKIQYVSNQINKKTQRGDANFMVVSPDIATILESIPGFAVATDGTKNEFSAGIKNVGSFKNRYKVYKNPYLDKNTILIGFKGKRFLETGAVYAPYIPLIMSPVVHSYDNFTQNRGLMSRYAKTVVKPEFYGKIFVADLAHL